MIMIKFKINDNHNDQSY